MLTDGPFLQLITSQLQFRDLSIFQQIWIEAKPTENMNKKERHNRDKDKGKVVPVLN